MKKILLHTSIIALAAMAVASCNINSYPVFDDNDAFAAFDVLEEEVTEPEKGKTTVVEIPVTLASVAGLDATVSFTVAPETYDNPDTEEVEAIVIGAEEDKHYKVLNEGKILTFNAEQRTDYVRIEVLDVNSGVVNDDLKFYITLSGSQQVNIGAENVCEVVIADRDDIRNPVVGTYKVNLSDGTTWDLKVAKDTENAEQVLFSNLCNFAPAGLPATTAFAGTIVRDEKDPNKAITTIEIELGQTSDGDSPLTLVGAKPLGGYAYQTIDEGKLIVTITSDANGPVLEFKSTVTVDEKTKAESFDYTHIAVVDGNDNVLAPQVLPLKAVVPPAEK